MYITPVGREKTKCSQLRQVCGRMSWAANIRVVETNKISSLAAMYFNAIENCFAY